MTPLVTGTRVRHPAYSGVGTVVENPANTTRTPEVAYGARAWLAALAALGVASAGGCLFATGHTILAVVAWLVAFLTVGVALEQAETGGITNTLELMDHVEMLRGGEASG